MSRKLIPMPGPVSSRHLILAGLLVAASLGPVYGGVPGVRGASVLESSPEALVFRVVVENYRLRPSPALEGYEELLVPGYTTRSRPGEPAVPARKFLVALPPGGSWRLAVEIERSVDLGNRRIVPVPYPVLPADGSEQPLPSERYEVGEPYFDYLSPPVVSADSAAFIRSQRVLPIWVSPASYDPATGTLSMATSIVVRVFFGGGKGIDTGEMLEPVEPPIWRGILDRALLNPAQARAWRSKGRARTAPERPRSGEAPTQGPLFKVEIRSTGIHSIDAATLLSLGFPSGIAVSNVRLFKRYYDEATLSDAAREVASLVLEDPSGAAGVFDGADRLVFYAQRLREDSLQSDPIEKFSDHNVYWIGVGPAARMEAVVLERGFVSADTAALAFTVRKHCEEDRYFQEQTPPASVLDEPLGQDSYFYVEPNAPRADLPFRVHAIEPQTTLSIEAEFLGGNLANTRIREVRLSIVNGKGAYPLNSLYISGNDRVLYKSQDVPSDVLAEGENVLRLEPEAGQTRIDALLNWFDVEYSSLYRADGDLLSFHTGALAGDTSISVTGLSRRDLMLFDVTDPYRVKECILADSLFVPDGTAYVLSFRDRIVSPKKYLLLPGDSVIAVNGSDIERVDGTGIIGSPAESGVDVLVVAHGDFLGEMQRWVDYRRAQGYRVLMVDVEDVFNEFNGGVPNARALKRFIRHFYEKGNAAVVLLVGDASEDNKRVHADSGPNFVPTQSYPERIQSFPFNEDEVVTTDKWYVLMDNDFLVYQTDYYPDLIMGRLPAGDVRELRVMLDKIFKFESPEASDFWRRRMIQVADDSWSSAGFTGETCYRDSETGFEEGEEEAAALIDSSLAGGFDVVRFYLSRHTSVVHPENSGCMDNDPVVSYTRANALPELLAEIEKGATLVSIQAHMNRYLITHEQLFSSSQVIGKDHQKLQNFGKPFVVFGMGCHMSDYAIYRELARTINNDVNGDCLDELLLLLNDRGAVSTYGSSGFEYLGENRYYTNRIYEVFFQSPPVDTMIASSRAQARWIFGELMTLSEITAANTGQIKRYHVLGDPLLRIDAGPPRFDVTVDGRPVTSGSTIKSGSSTDTIRVRAVVADENAIERFELAVAGVDMSDSLLVTPLVDQDLSAARKYLVEFTHKLEPRAYDIVLRALQAPDTISGKYHIAAEFTLHVPLLVELEVNGRKIQDGEMVPSAGTYLLTIDFPIVVSRDEIEVRMDDVLLTGVDFTHPSPEDSTVWLISFDAELSEGEHELVVSISGDEVRRIRLVVGSATGIVDLIAYPNPFSDGTYFVFTNETVIEDGTIDVFTTSGKRIVSIPFPSVSRMPGQNAVFWDGRDSSGQEIANGIYLYVIRVVQKGETHVLRGKLAKID